MNIGQINSNLENLLLNFNKETFISDLLLAYGTPKATIARAQLKEKSLFDEFGNDVVIKKKVFFRPVGNADLQSTWNELRTNEKVRKQEPRFIIVTDFETLLATDTKTNDTLDIPLIDINRHFDFFLSWAGMEKHKITEEQEADVKAAERMAKLYDEICKENPTETPEQIHSLNVFLSRLLFCYFAEDTGIFEKDLFTNSIDSHTQTDGSGLNVYLDTLFDTLNTDYRQRNPELPEYLKVFPYVNGGLFSEYYAAPAFTQRSRRMLIDAGGQKWQDINPDIFGSMIQAVVTPEHRGGLGMHYTSVPNIMKVTEPLFLNELQELFQAAKGNKKKLEDLLKRIWKIKIFDPACGSGNFLIIAYKKLRELEMDIFNELDRLKGQEGAKKIDFEDKSFSEISLNNFYGIELDDFAHEIATLSLWLAEHQMNQEFKRLFGRSKPSLPLKQTGNIVHGNACRLEWEAVCSKNEGDEVYILGNPPYLGSRRQDDLQKEDLKLVFETEYKSLDYIAAWFFKGAKYIKNYKAKCAFVSTNSICQGEQVFLTWNRIFEQNIEIDFARTSFKWKNNAKANAGVTVIIVGIRNNSNSKKYIFHENIQTTAENISPYLINTRNIIVKNRTNPISEFPQMNFGNMPADGGKFFFSNIEKDEFIKLCPESIPFFRSVYGAEEFINGKERWCLWFENCSLEELHNIPQLKNRIDEVRDIRLLSSRPQLAQNPHLFAQITQDTNNDFILIPSVSSENRKYIPIGYLTNEKISTNLCLIISNPQLYLFSILTSNIHMSWVKSVGGKLETRYRYSKDVVYNNFPFPPISDKQKQELEQHTYNIISEREKHSEKTLAELYDPDKMPDGLREAHRLNDLAVERCYRSKPFESDEERLEYLFKLYEQMIAEEKERGTLFEGEKKKKKKK